MKAIFQFENHQSAASSFRRKHLEPHLTQTGQMEDTKIFFQDYLNRACAGAPPFSPSQIAAQTYAVWNSMNPVPDKTVWFIDLDATGGNDPDSSYGLCVLQNLIVRNFSIAISQFLDNRNFLAVILTLFPGYLREKDGVARLTSPICDLGQLDKSWSGIRQVTRSIDGSNHTTAIIQSIDCINRAGPRIVLANSRAESAWAGELAVAWLDQ